MGLNDMHSLSHSKWNCKYLIMFVPKYIKKQLEEDPLGEQLSISEADHLRKQKKQAKNTQQADRYLRVIRAREEQGLCPRDENPAFYAGLVFFLYIFAVSFCLTIVTFSFFC